MCVYKGERSAAALRKQIFSKQATGEERRTVSSSSSDALAEEQQETNDEDLGSDCEDRRSAQEQGNSTLADMPELSPLRMISSNFLYSPLGSTKPTAVTTTTKLPPSVLKPLPLKMDDTPLGLKSVMGGASELDSPFNFKPLLAAAPKGNEKKGSSNGKGERSRELPTIDHDEQWLMTEPPTGSSSKLKPKGAVERALRTGRDVTTKGHLYSIDDDGGGGNDRHAAHNHQRGNAQVSNSRERHMVWERLTQSIGKDEDEIAEGALDEVSILLDELDDDRHHHTDELVETLSAVDDNGQQTSAGERQTCTLLGRGQSSCWTDSLRQLSAVDARQQLGLAPRYQNERGEEADDEDLGFDFYRKQVREEVKRKASPSNADDDDDDEEDTSLFATAKKKDAFSSAGDYEQQEEEEEEQQQQQQQQQEEEDELLLLQETMKDHDRENSVSYTNSIICDASFEEIYDNQEEEEEEEEVEEQEVEEEASEIITTTTNGTRHDGDADLLNETFGLSSAEAADEDDALLLNLSVDQSLCSDLTDIPIAHHHRHRHQSFGDEEFRDATTDMFAQERSPFSKASDGLTMMMDHDASFSLDTTSFEEMASVMDGMLTPAATDGKRGPRGRGFVAGLLDSSQPRRPQPPQPFTPTTLQTPLHQQQQRVVAKAAAVGPSKLFFSPRRQSPDDHVDVDPFLKSPEASDLSLLLDSLDYEAHEWTRLNI